MKRNDSRAKAHKKKKKGKKSLPRGTYRTMGPRGIQPVKRCTLQYRTLVTVNNAANVGANQSFFIGTPSTMNGATLFPGLNEFYGNSAGNTLYLQLRPMSARLRVSAANLDTFPSRVSIAFVPNLPANNALSTQALQNPYLNKTASHARERVVGPLTGAGICTLGVGATLKSLFGVTTLPGMVDPFTTYWETASNATVVAVQGLSFLLMVAGSSNLVSGVSFDVVLDVTFEFSNRNPTKTS